MTNIKILQILIDGRSAIRTELKDVKKIVVNNGERIGKLGPQLARPRKT